MRQLLHVLVAAVCVSTLSAQDVAEEENREARGRVAWIVYTSMPEGMENPVTLMIGSDLLDVTLSKRSPSQPVKIPGDGLLRIVRKVENKEDSSKPRYLTLAQAMVPEGVGKALVILMPAAENPRGLVFDTKVVNLADFKGGSWLFLNTSPRKVGVEMGETSLHIEPGETKIYGDGVQSEATNMTIRYYFQKPEKPEMPEKPEWKILSASTVVIYPTRREICIFSWDPRFKRMDYHGITFPVTE